MNKILIMILASLISVAFLTLVERKILSYIGLRLGPNKNLIIGLIQPIYDAIKISQKQTNVLSNFSFFFFYFGSLMMILSSFFLISLININFSFMDWKCSIMMFLLIMSTHTLFLIFIGWSSYTKYSVISVLRTISQLISYEIVIYMVMMFILLYYGSFSILYFSFNISMFIFFPLVFLFWFISILAETSRSPFDFSESESELVSGFNVDFGSKLFSIIFLSEYANLMFMCIYTSLFFFFYNYNLFFIFFTSIYLFIIWIRSLFPRLRYDTFMNISWKFMMPYLTLYLLFFLYMA